MYLKALLYINFLFHKLLQTIQSIITKSDIKEKVGGITKTGNVSTISAGIGGITKVNKNENSTSTAAGKVGGITRMNKTVAEPEPRVGGITRMRK